MIPFPRSPLVVRIDDLIGMLNREMNERTFAMRKGINEIKDALDIERGGLTWDELDANDKYFAILDDLAETSAQRIALIKLQMKELFRWRKKLTQAQ